MQITLNGTPIELPDGTTAADLLRERGIRPGSVVVEVDRQIVPPDTLADCELRNGGEVELIQFVGGG